MTPSGTVPSPDGEARIVAGRYRLGPVLGAGGMATVHRAEDESLGRTVAIKLFHAELADAGDDRRQREEVSLLAGLSHPALVTLFDAGRDAEAAYLVMEYVDGRDLRVRLGASSLTSREAVRIGADIASALAYIHARGVIHRDVKPANILLPERDGGPGLPHAKLADFGIARLIDSTRLTATGLLIGTASFLSPEQARGAEVGAASDVYSLGLVLLEGLTGVRAFPGTAAESALARLSRDPAIPSSLGAEWSAVLSQATARNPADRPTAESLAARIRSIDDDGRTLLLPVGTETTERLTPAEPGTTARLPAAGAGTTARMPAAGHETTVRLPVGAEPRRPRSRRVAIGAAAAISVAVVALAIVVALGQQQRAGESTAVDYPAVDGDLGTHLSQLQQSVEP